MVRRITVAVDADLKNLEKITEYFKTMGDDVTHLQIKVKEAVNKQSEQVKNLNNEFKRLRSDALYQVEQAVTGMTTDLEKAEAAAKAYGEQIQHIVTEIKNLREEMVTADEERRDEIENEVKTRKQLLALLKEGQKYQSGESARLAAKATERRVAGVPKGPEEPQGMKELFQRWAVSIKNVIRGEDEKISIQQKWKRAMTGALIDLHVLRILGQQSSVVAAMFEVIAKSIGYVVDMILLPAIPAMIELGQIIMSLGEWFTSLHPVTQKIISYGALVVGALLFMTNIVLSVTGALETLGLAATHAAAATEAEAVAKGAAIAPVAGGWVAGTFGVGVAAFLSSVMFPAVITAVIAYTVAMLAKPYVEPAVDSWLEPVYKQYPEERTHTFGYAAGGPLRLGQTAIVGEDGPEMLVPTTNGFNVIPNKGLRFLQEGTVISDLSGYLSDIFKGFTEVGTVISDVATNVLSGAVGSAFGLTEGDTAQSLLAKGFTATVSSIVEGFKTSNIILSAILLLLSPLNVLLSGAKSIWDFLTGEAREIWYWIKDTAREVWHWITGKAKEVWEWIKGTAREIWTWISGTAREIWHWITDKARDIWEWITTTSKDIWLFITGKTREVWEWIVGTAKALWGEIITIAGGIGKALWGVIITGAEIAKALWGDIITLAGGVGKALWGAIITGAEAGKSLWGAIITGLEPLKRLWGDIIAIPGMTKNLWGDIISWPGKSLSLFGDILSNVKTRLFGIGSDALIWYKENLQLFGAKGDSLIDISTAGVTFNSMMSSEFPDIAQEFEQQMKLPMPNIASALRNTLSGIAANIGVLSPPTQSGTPDLQAAAAQYTGVNLGDLGGLPGGTGTLGGLVATGTGRYGGYEFPIWETRAGWFAYDTKQNIYVPYSSFAGTSGELLNYVHVGQTAEPTTPTTPQNTIGPAGETIVPKEYKFPSRVEWDALDANKRAEIVNSGVVYSIGGIKYKYGSEYTENKYVAPEAPVNQQNPVYPSYPTGDISGTSVPYKTEYTNAIIVRRGAKDAATGHRSFLGNINPAHVINRSGLWFWSNSAGNNYPVTLREGSNPITPSFEYIWEGDPALVPGLSLGGRILKSGLSWVGERGRELAWLPKGAEVSPDNSYLREALGNLDKPQVVDNSIEINNPIFQILGRDDRQLFEEFLRWMEREGRRVRG